jgi:transcriptional regulator with XRE-family HTH domain
MIEQSGRAFNDWLRAQLKVKKMSQRQLAQQSGVDHSTISRLIRGDRMPSLGTATKLARGLRELHDDAEPPQYLGLVNAGTANPVARVEYALRADELLAEPDVRQVMELYLSVRLRRFGRRGPGDGGNGVSADGPRPIRPNVWNSGTSASPRVGMVARTGPVQRPARSVSGRPPGRY